MTVGRRSRGRKGRFPWIPVTLDGELLFEGFLVEALLVEIFLLELFLLEAFLLEGLLDGDPLGGGVGTSQETFRFLGGFGVAGGSLCPASTSRDNRTVSTFDLLHSHSSSSDFIHTTIESFAWNQATEAVSIGIRKRRENPRGL
jgi:hypothetical protein